MKMRYLVAAFAVGIVLLILTGKGKHGPGAAPPGGGKINWFTDLQPALAKAKETGQPIMIDFYADWCGPCKMLDAQTYSDDRVAAASTNLVMVRIDVDRNQLLSSQYRVQAIPTIVVLNSDGTEMNREQGFMPVGPMLKMMEQATAKN
jgi:thiol:disulfide interchange protein DsbD